MRFLGNYLGDPTLHMMAIALIVAYLAFGRSAMLDESKAEAPLPTCSVCHGHYLPGLGCEGRHPAGFARAR